MSAFDPYTPERAEPEAVAVPAPEPEKAPFWTLRRRRIMYWGALVALIASGIQQGIITAEAAGAWLDALAASGPGLAALAGGIGSLILALRNPTPDGSM